MMISGGSISVQRNSIIAVVAGLVIPPRRSRPRGNATGTRSRRAGRETGTQTQAHGTSARREAGEMLSAGCFQPALPSEPDERHPLR
jgi:hypothetical protein